MGNLADACTATGLQPGNAAAAASNAGDAGAGSIAGGATGAITAGN